MGLAPILPECSVTWAASSCQVAASRVLAWSQLARQKAGCLVAAGAVLPKNLMNAPRKPFPDLTPEGPHIFQQKNVLNSARGARYPRV
jgi:hypothetical protein